MHKETCAGYLWSVFAVFYALQITTMQWLECKTQLSQLVAETLGNWGDCKKISFSAVFKKRRLTGCLTGEGQDQYKEKSRKQVRNM